MTRVDSPGRPARSGRAQSNLVSVAVALVALTAALGLGLALADAAFAGADRQADERATAVALSERLVAPDSPLTDRANVLDADAVAAFDADRLEEAFPVVGDRAVRVRLDDRTLASRGDPHGGRTIRRVVVVADRTAVTRTPALGAGGATTLPRRTTRVDVRIDTPDGTTVRTVRANDRVVLHDPSGLEGNHTVEVSRLDTVRLSFEASGPLPEGSVAVTYYPATTTKAVLEVTVGA